MAELDTIASNFTMLIEQRMRNLEAERQRAVTTDPRPEADQEETTYHALEQDGKVTAIWAKQGISRLSPIDPTSQQGLDILDSLKVERHKATETGEQEGQETDDRTAFATLITKSVEMASISGRFAPDAILLPAQITTEAARQAVLSWLAPLCVVETHEGEVRWLLQKDPRKSALTRLKEQGRLASMLGEVLPPTDLFGNMLRRLLTEGVGMKLKKMGREDLLALTSAMEATAEVGLPHPDEAELRHLIGQAEFLADYDVLLAKGFFGRGRELKQLRAFVDKPKEPGSRSQNWGGIMLTGLGGSGKSTLLAKFARGIVKRWKATVVILDFDRPGIEAGDSYWLEQEICRQVGHQYPQTDQFLRQRRIEEREHRADYGETVQQSTPDAEEFERSSRASIISSVSVALKNVKADALPFLLVLDTFEEVAEQGLAEKILNWLFDLAVNLHPVELKVIFSGRLFDDTHDILKTSGVTEIIEVKELAPSQAEKLLVSNNVPVESARRLARSDVVPRRPLELTLFAKITTDLDKTIDELEQEVRAGGKSAQGLFAGLIYRRILRRLGDTAAQQLAYPGLVLRYVTPELIREVLAPALNIPLLDDAEARQALDALASFSWLAYRGPDGEVWHRKDLRRSTLKAMIAEEPQKARRINEYATEYFSTRGGDKDAAEAVYHRLMQTLEPEEGESFELGELKRASEFIGADAADLPPTAAALLRFATRGKVAPHEVELLPSRYLHKAYRTAGRRLVNSREFRKALKLLSRRGEGRVDLRLSEPLDSWEIEALFAAAAWNDLKKPVMTEIPAVQNITFKALADLLYPFEIVQPGPISPSRVWQMMMWARENERKLSTSLWGTEAEGIIHKLTCGIISVSGRDASNPDMIEAVGAFLDFIRGLKRLLSPVLERRLWFLERSILGKSAALDLRLTVHTIKLDAEWVEDILSRINETRYGGPEAPVELRHLLNEVGRVLKGSPGGRRTVRELLSAIDAKSKKGALRRGARLKIKWEMQDTESVINYFRGPDPEFRDPCRYALLEAFSTRGARRRLGEIIASVVHSDLEDLEPDAFADALAAEPEHTLDKYVELVDRNWKLDQLLHRTRLEAADSAKLKDVSSAYEQWDSVMRNTIMRAVER